VINIDKILAFDEYNTTWIWFKSSFESIGPDNHMFYLFKILKHIIYVIALFCWKCVSPSQKP